MKIVENHLANLMLLTIMFCSCSSEATLVCEDVYIPQAVKVSFIAEDGRDLFFGENPIFSVDDLKIYHENAEQNRIISREINTNEQYIILYLDQNEGGSLLIEFSPLNIGRMDYVSSKVLQVPCDRFKVTAMAYSEGVAVFHPERDLWQFTVRF